MFGPNPLDDLIHINGLVFQLEALQYGGEQ
jgi:hypothetical protein